MVCFKIVAFFSQLNPVQRLIGIIENAVAKTRSEEGLNQGVCLFSVDESNRAVCKIHAPLDAVNVQIASEILGIFGLNTSQSFIVSQPSSEYDRLEAFFSQQTSDRELKMQLKGDHVFLVMDFVDATTFSDLLPDEMERAFLDPAFFNKLGRALFVDLLLGNHDRFVFLNLSNIMMNKGTGDVIFIDNNIDYSLSEPELPNDISKIVKGLVGETEDNPIEAFFKLLNDSKLGMDSEKGALFCKGLYGGFCSAYDTLSSLVEGKFSGLTTSSVQGEHANHVRSPHSSSKCNEGLMRRQKVKAFSGAVI